MADHSLSQSETILNIFLKALSEEEKLDQILAYLVGQNELFSETYFILEQEIGNLGHSDFWFSLHQAFPTNGQLTLATANANLTALNADIRIYGPLFILAIQQTGDVYQVGNEVGALLLDSPYRFDFQLLFLEAALKDWAIYPADAEEEINDLLGEYPFDTIKIKQIQRLIEQYSLA
jgi:hypothetical protein